MINSIYLYVRGPPWQLSKKPWTRDWWPGAMAGCMGPRLPEAGGAGFHFRKVDPSIYTSINVGKIYGKMLKHVENMEKIWTNVETYGKIKANHNEMPLDHQLDR